VKRYDGKLRLILRGKRGGKAAPVQLPELLTPAKVLEGLAQAAK